MNKVYFIAPLAALALFVAAYTVSQGGQKERARIRQEQVKAEHEARLAAEREARRIAIEEALVVQEKRKKERAEKDARDTAEREARMNAVDARDKVYREQEKLTRQIERLKRETALEQEAVNKLQIDHDAALAEKTFLSGAVPQSRANVTALEDVLNKIDATEAARVRLAAEAAAAAAKKS